MAVDLTSIQQRLQSIPPRVIGMMHPMLHTLIIKDLPGMVKENNSLRSERDNLQKANIVLQMELGAARSEIVRLETSLKGAVDRGG